jgi:hypothetical protein
MKKRVRQLVGFGGVERERERESIWDWWRKWPAYRNLHEAIKTKILSWAAASSSTPSPVVKMSLGHSVRMQRGSPLILDRKTFAFGFSGQTRNVSAKIQQQQHGK